MAGASNRSRGKPWRERQPLPAPAGVAAHAMSTTALSAFLGTACAPARRLRALGGRSPRNLSQAVREEPLPAEELLPACLVHAEGQRVEGLAREDGVVALRHAAKPCGENGNLPIPRRQDRAAASSRPYARGERRPRAACGSRRRGPPTSCFLYDRRIRKPPHNPTDTARPSHDAQ